MIVERKRTPLLDHEMIGRLAGALEMVEGVPAEPRRVLILASHLALEHGAKDAEGPLEGLAAWNCWNWNWGNRRGITGDAGVYMMTAKEIIDGRSVDVYGEWPAFSRCDVGMETWLHMLAERYSEAWACASEPKGSTPDVATRYARGLKHGGYYTASVSLYAAGVRRWAQRLEGMV
jgi:hypothetical protein